MFDSGTRIFIVSEHASGLNLRQIFDEKLKDCSSWFSSEEIYRFLQSMLRLLHYFLGKTFIHLNIRPGIFLSNLFIIKAKILIENVIITERGDLCSFKLRIYDFWNESRKVYLFNQSNEDFLNFLYTPPEMLEINHTMNKANRFILKERKINK